MQLSTQEVLTPVNSEKIHSTAICASGHVLDADRARCKTVKAPTETNNVENSRSSLNYKEKMNKALEINTANNDNEWLESSYFKRFCTSPTTRSAPELHCNPAQILEANPLPGGSLELLNITSLDTRENSQTSLDRSVSEDPNRPLQSHMALIELIGLPSRITSVARDKLQCKQSSLFLAPVIPINIKNTWKPQLNGPNKPLDHQRHLVYGNSITGSSKASNDIAVENQVLPSAMSTREIFGDSTCLETCLKLLSQVATEPGAAANVADQLGIGLASNQPDISSSYLAEDNNIVDGEKSLNERLICGKKQAGPDNDNGEQEENVNIQDKWTRGKTLIKELIVRSDLLSQQKDEYVPQGDEFDLSQSSMCMLYTFKDYAQHSRNYKIIKRKIQMLSLEELKEYYEKFISRTLKDITDGKTMSLRMNLYLESESGHVQSLNSWERLKSIHTQAPFTEHQVQHVLSLIRCNFLDNGKTFTVSTAVDLNRSFKLPFYVLLPEALIRIFGFETGLSLKRAELLMRNGAIGYEN